MSLANPFDAEAFWRSEIIKDPGNAHALRRYGDLLRGSNLIDESAAYLARAISLADKESRDWCRISPRLRLRRPEANSSGPLRSMKRNVERFPDLTDFFIRIGGDFGEAGEISGSRSFTSAAWKLRIAAWAYFARMTMGAIRCDFSPRSNELAHLFADPRANNSMRGAVSFILGDVEAGVGYWREMQPASLPLWWDYITGMSGIGHLA